MIREFTKSALSFSWALSLLTLKQATNLARPGQQGSDLFAPISQAAVSQLDESMKGFYRSGDGFQTRMVDMAFSFMNPGNLFSAGNWQNMGNWANPMTWMNSMGNCGQAAGGCGGQTGAGQSSYQTRPPQSAPAGGAPVNPSANAPVSNESAAAGWGPMPGN